VFVKATTKSKGEFFLNEEHERLAAEIEAFAGAEVEPRAAESPDYTAQALDFLRRLAQAGFLRHVVPRNYGGLQPQLDIRSLCVIRSALARHSALADTMFAMQGLGSYPITLAGSDALKRRFLPAVAGGTAVAAFALTEPQAGSDAAGIETRARRDGSSYILDGTKRFISNAGIADFYVVFAKTDPSQGRKGISGFVVEKDRPGLRMVRQIELIAPHPIGEFAMESCRIPAENLLASEGDGYAILLRTLESFRTTVGAAAVGMAERALEEATSYARTRAQFGKTLAEFQGLRFRLAEMATELEAARLLVLQAAAMLDRAREVDAARRPSAAANDPALIVASSMAKFYATETAQRVIDGALQIHGGLGVVKGTVVERLYREVRALRVYEGTSEIQKEIISHQLLKA
jgi:acyl-CoA dehydrogenase